MARIARYRETISVIVLWGFWCLNMANWVQHPLQCVIPPPISRNTLSQRRVSHPFPLFKKGIAHVSPRDPFGGGGGYRTSTSHALQRGNTQKRGPLRIQASSRDFQAGQKRRGGVGKPPKDPHENSFRPPRYVLPPPLPFHFSC